MPKNTSQNGCLEVISNISFFWDTLQDTFAGAFARFFVSRERNKKHIFSKFLAQREPPNIKLNSHHVWHFGHTDHYTPLKASRYHLKERFLSLQVMFHLPLRPDINPWIRKQNLSRANERSREQNRIVTKHWCWSCGTWQCREKWKDEVDSWCTCERVQWWTSWSSRSSLFAR